jgi:hypothetical protein
LSHFATKRGATPTQRATSAREAPSARRRTMRARRARPAEIVVRRCKASKALRVVGVRRTTRDDLRPRAIALFHLLCEFARKKENPSLERYITSPYNTFSSIVIQYWDARLTLASFSAAPPVIRGRGHSPASSCLFVRDQEPSYASHFRPCWLCCRHKEGNEVAVVTLFMPERECLDPCRALPQSFLS